jgi:uncharacterized membrane protein
MQYAQIPLLLIHVLASAALFGAMFYSITLIQPKAKRFFQKPEDFEEFITFISNGARWKVLGGYAVIAITGFALIPFHHSPMSRTWMILITTKIILLAAAVIFFSYVSWRLWPSRVFATPEEIPKYQRLFRLVGFVMITFVTIDFVLGVVAHGF